MDYFGIFAKHWQPGKVKTRLARSIGEKRAAEVYYSLLSHLGRTLCAAGDSRVIAYSPAAQLDPFRVFIGDLARSQWSGDASSKQKVSPEREVAWDLTPQSDGGLGERMSHFFHSAFERGATNAVLIGSDCPAVTPDVCQRAFAELKKNDVVLGPTYDGGYYLIGMSGQFRDVFSEIEFSTTSVWDATTKKLNDDQVSFAQLPVLNDIDEIDDLQSYLAALQKNDQSHGIGGDGIDGETKQLLHDLTRLLSDGADA